MYPHGCSLGYPRIEPKELETLQVGRVAYPQDYLRLPTFFHAHGVHHCRYVVALFSSVLLVYVSLRRRCFFRHHLVDSGKYFVSIFWRILSFR